MLVDSHCHLDQLADPAGVMREAADRGVERIVAVSEDLRSMRAVLDLKERRGGGVMAGLGLHPAWIVQCGDGEIARSLEFLSDHLSAADELGEVGLDHKWAGTPDQQRRQETVLERQFALAADCGKPVNLHSRRCQRQVMERAIDFHRNTGLGAQLHWFTQSKKLARICNEEGIYISVGPAIIDDPQAQEVACTVADDLLLLESDAPAGIGGRANHPALVRAVAEKIAALKDCALERVAEMTSANFDRYLGTSRQGAGLTPCSK